MLTNLLKEAKFELMNDGIKAEWNPDENALAECVEFGKKIGSELK